MQSNDRIYGRPSTLVSQRARGAARAQAQQQPTLMWMFGALVAGTVVLFSFTLAHAQTSPSEAPAARVIPDRVAPPTGSPSVIQPPAMGSMPVIPPPATGSMPVITPPGAAGGGTTVIPK